MKTPRRIPVLQILRRRLVKTTNFTNPIYIGDPLNAVRIFNEKKVDELIITDITPEISKTGPDFDYLEKLFAECHMPIGYGGGVRNLQDAKTIFQMGAEKTIFNSLAFINPKELALIASKYGNQAVSISIDYKKRFLGSWNFYIEGGRKKIKFDVRYIYSLLRQTNAGELILHNIKNDGTLKGYEYSLFDKIKNELSIPVVILGGASGHNDLDEAIGNGLHSVAAGSMFVFQGPHRAVLIQY